ncbi:MAG: MFS transporter, partial [Polyangiales bacterium]
FLQGVGAASLGALNVTLVGDLYEGRRRATAMGLNASVLSLGTTFYPALGGALALGSWRWPFVLPLLAVPVGLLVLLALRNPRPPPPQGLREYLRGAFAAMRNRTVAGLLFATIATFVILYGSYLTYLPLRMEKHFDSDSFVIGVVMSSGSLTTALVSSQLGKLSVRFGQRRLIQSGFALYAVSLGLVLSVRSQWAMLLPALVFGVAQGINIPTIMDALSGRAPMAYRAGFMSVNGMVLRGGQTLGPVAMGGAFALGGGDAPFWAGIGVAVGGLALLLASLREPG